MNEEHAIQIDREHAIEWYINRFIRLKGAANWMKRRHGITKPDSKDVERKIHTTDRRRYFDHDVNFFKVENKISIHPLQPSSGWLSGTIDIHNGNYRYTSTIQNIMFENTDKAKEK